MTSRWLAYVVAAAVAVAAGTWALRLFAPTDSAPRTSSVEPVVNASSRVTAIDANRSDQTRSTAYLSPAAPMTAPTASGDHFNLVGVVAPRESVAGSQWVALIAVDGGPARAFTVGATVEGDVVLRDVSARGAILGPREGSAAMALDVMPAPATGMAPAPTSGPGLESLDVFTGPRSKYMQLPPPEPEPVDRSAEADDGRWRPATGP